MPGPLSDRELELMHAYWRACNYLSVGMIYLQDTRCSWSRRDVAAEMAGKRELLEEPLHPGPFESA